VFLGQRKVTLSVQVDDIFTSNQLWQGANGDGQARIYRLSAVDVKVLVAWLNRVQKQHNTHTLTLHFAFNGAAATPVPADRVAVEAFIAHRHRFYWINHGYTHLLLDEASRSESLEEIQRNQESARILDLAPYEPDCMVTADMSGLANPAFLGAAAECGIRFLVSDTSRRGWGNPSANTGIKSDVEPSITMIPRHPNNLFYDVTTPQEWCEQYNQAYRAIWQRDLSISEIIGVEARQLLQYLLLGDRDPLMFHQANLCAYDDTHSLLTDLLDEVLFIYNEYCGHVPIVGTSMRTIGEMMIQRANYDQARIDACLVVGGGLVLISDRDVEVPVTGVQIHGNGEEYGGQASSTVALKAGVIRSIPAANLASQSSGWA
jgi:hypothetical protein